MIGSGTTPDRGSRDDLPDSVLRAKYLDYCSARVAEVLLRLTADEMYLLAHEGEDPPSFGTMVKVATDRISRQLALPDFPEWANEYRANPEYYEQKMIGLWEAELNPSNPAAH